MSGGSGIPEANVSKLVSPFPHQRLPGWTSATRPIRLTSTTCADGLGECSRAFTWHTEPLFCTFKSISPGFLALQSTFPVSVVTHQVHSGGSVTQGHADPGGRVSDDLLSHL